MEGQRPLETAEVGDPDACVMVGNFGLLPFPILQEGGHVAPPDSSSSGSPSFTFWLVQFWHTVPRNPNSQFRLICSGLSCWREWEGCHAEQDSFSHHRASCTRSGRVKKWATGAIVRWNVFLKDMHVGGSQRPKKS